MSDKLETLLFVPAIGIFVLLFVLAPASASADDKTTWMKYNNAVPGNTNTTSTDGRIPLGTSGKGDNAYVIYQTVIKDGPNYKMWYAGHDGSTWRIYYATSTNGLTWTKYDNSIPDPSDTTSTNGRIPLGVSGGDINGSFGPSVIKDGYTYKMWYAGIGGTPNTWRIYHAMLDQLPEGTIFYGY